MQDLPRAGEPAQRRMARKRDLAAAPPDARTRRRAGADPKANPRFDPTAHEIRPFTERTSLLIAPGREPVLVVAPARSLVRLLARCDGSSSIARIAAASEDPVATLALLRGLADAGCLSMIEEETSGCIEATG